MQKTLKCAIINNELNGSLFSTGFYGFKSIYNKIKYLKLFIESPYYQILKDSFCSGVTQKSINDEKLLNILIAIPPINEQEKIINKLISLDKFMKKYLEKENQLFKLDSEIKDKLQKSILQYAIQGKLVKQDPNDEPASKLLEAIQIEKNKLIKEGKIKKDKHESFIFQGEDKNYYEKIGSKVINITNEIPFEIPKNWVIVKISNISFRIDKKNIIIKTKQILSTGKYPIITQGQKFIEGYTNNVNNIFKVKEPIIIFGDHTKTTKFVDFNFVPGGDGTVFLKPLKINPLFFYYLVNYLSKKIRNRGYARHYILLKKEIIPIPNINEQNQIVSKIKKVFYFINCL
ncbi:EcoKI restriction-modification system protein HsdS (plasmid) [Mesomycoplasma conjunctivae]|uniref:Type I restriction modification DNA specificity domain-containing protein n=2 Tax=Mycoplasmopsis fermentans TaxID=2115 RepID=A0AB32XBZ4_MYCFM|nr:Hypothetical Protein MfeM64YM_0570 [Mycoplasmopsis fermentans M64]VEU64123.1 EcoKI restriction-modification system protein HsdS [Mycoplasmopsis fermentans]VEU66762.1 EcoKI restriction-modification system protein HsdS [Mesomycoplasma conjunctivae]